MIYGKPENILFVINLQHITRERKFLQKFISSRDGPEKVQKQGIK